MLKKLFCFFYIGAIINAPAQNTFSNNSLYKIEAQPKDNFIYFKPEGEDFFAGDPMPFFAKGIFHIYYLLDLNHASNEFGGHSWAHISTMDFIHWKYHPIALALDSLKEKSICTGSVITANNKYYAFYAERNDLNNDKEKEEYVKYAISDSTESFQKMPDRNTIPLPPQYSQAHDRDPHVYYDSKSNKYYLLVTTANKNSKVKNLFGTLIYYTSDNLRQWKFEGEFYTPAIPEGFSIPECSEIFDWNGWYYLIFKVNGGTFYRKSKNITGPWVVPFDDNIGSDYAMVLKTAAFKNGRRIAVGFVPSRENNKDNGAWQYGGNLVMRELFQLPNGDLSTAFVSELKNIYKIQTQKMDLFKINSANGFDYSDITEVPVNCRIKLNVDPQNVQNQFGFFLRKFPNEPHKDFTAVDDNHYRLSFYPKLNKICLGNNCLDGIIGLDKPFSLEIIMDNDIIEICINNSKCHINRCPEKKGTTFSVFVIHGKVNLKDMEIFSK